MTRSTAFVRPLSLAGWAAGSRWGFDPALECYWAELTPSTAGAAPVRIGPEHLISTVDGLSRAVARAGRLCAEDAFLALTA